MEVEGTTAASTTTAEEERKENDASVQKTETNTNEAMTPVQEVIHFEPDEQMDPFRHWAMKKPDLYSGFLYVAFRCNDEDASFYRANFKAADSTVFMDDNSSDDLVKIFARVLHPLLFRKDYFNEPKEEKDGIMVSSSRPSSEYVLPSSRQQEQQQLALRSLYALSSGRLMSSEEQKEVSGASLASHESIKRKAIECAKDLAKELLLSRKKKTKDRDSMTAKTTMKKTKDRDKEQDWRSILSPIAENLQKEPRMPDLSRFCEQKGHELPEPEAPLPYILGFLLFGAAWVVSN